ncbi:hypothetical protein [Bernardetia litoralis]|nr:hypothetical protein [Bernardetia litoralis]
MNTCTEHSVKIQSIIEIKEGYSVCIATYRENGSMVPYAGPIYAVDKCNRIYYAMNPDCSIEEMNETIVKGRNNWWFRIKEIIMNIYYNKIAPC